VAKHKFEISLDRWPDGSRHYVMRIDGVSMKISRHTEQLNGLAAWISDLASGFRVTGNQGTADKLKHLAESIIWHSGKIDGIVTEQAEVELRRTRESHDQLTAFVLTALETVVHREGATDGQ
jgi:hypothetical protein